MSDMGIQPTGPDPVGRKIAVSDIFAAAPAGEPDTVSIPAADPPAPDFWRQFGCAVAGDGMYLLAPGAVALQAAGEAQAALIEVMKALAVMPQIAILYDDHRQALYRMSDPALVAALHDKLPEGVALIQAGEPIDLPTDWDPTNARATSVAELSEITAAGIASIGKPPADPAVTSNPLLPFSLRGQSERFKRLAIEARPLLGEVCLFGQVTLWYAAPNSGKTLVALSLTLDAVREKRIVGGNVFYVNADDNGQGFATKLQILDDLGANTLSPNQQGFRTTELITLLHKMADRNEARGVLIIIDTIKKFASLMDKKESSEFAQACRRVAMMGGTVLGLAHTTKNRNSDGTPRFAGTTDLVDDADAAYTLDLIDVGGVATEKVVQFCCFKSRGECADTAAYAFAVGKGVSYEDKLASVRTVDPTQVDEFQRVAAERSDAEVIDAVSACIREGINTKMQLMKEVANRTGISGRAAGRLIEAYTGDDPARHHWRFRRREHGAQVFELIERPAE